MSYSKPAFLFPGQGSQKVGMGKSLAELNTVAKRIWQTADQELGWSIQSLAFGGPEESLKLTKNAQLALYVSGVAGLEALQRVGIFPSFCAGHSIGEYAALVAAKVISFEDGLRLVRVRCEAMERAAHARKGNMAAILSLDATIIDQLCQRAQSLGVVGIANYNSPDQIVISGEPAAVESVSAMAMQKGARRVIPLAVSGGFHSRLMQSAAKELEEALSAAEVQDPSIPIVLNVTADYAGSSNDIRQSLAKQIVKQVRWHESLTRLIADGCDAIVEIGPGKVLTGLAKRISDDLPTYNLDDAHGLDAIQKAWNTIT